MNTDSVVETINRTSILSEVHRPDLPACCPIPNGSLKPGSVITIYATAPTNQGRFRIDLYASNCQHVRKDGKSNYNPAERVIALHFNARFGEGPAGTNYVLMNSYQNGKWEQDQRSREFPFQANRPFCLMILTNEKKFKFYVDEKVFYEFEHRFNFKDISRIHIEGPNLIVNLVEFCDSVKRSTSIVSNVHPDETNESILNRKSRAVPEKLIAEPTVPYFEYDPNLSKPCDIHITGTILEPFTKYFVINLTATKNERTNKVNIPLHISIRVTQEKIIRNSMINGTWGQEETSLDSAFELKPGTNYNILIKNRIDQMLLIINEQHCCKFKHRTDPKVIDTMEISGSVTVTSIRYQFLE